MTELPERRQLAVCLAAYVAVWTSMRWLMDANLDPYGNMLEAFAWGQTFEWGALKHPPLMAWIAGLWFRILPTADVGFHLLAYLSAALGLWGVYEFARAFGVRTYALASALLLTLAFPYSTLAAKFNANTTLLALWPWVGLVFVRSVQSGPGSGGWAQAALLGVLGALAMLGKYYSALFLAGLFIASLASARGRRWYRTGRPWLALVSFLLVLSPHLVWMSTHGYVTLDYVSQQGDGTIAWDTLAAFAFAPVYYWLVPWLVCCALMARQSPRQSPPQQSPWWSGLGSRLVGSWRPRGRTDGLWWVVMTPWLISVTCGLVGFVRLSTPWAIPIGFGFPLLWFRNLSAGTPDPAGVQPRVRRIFWWALAAGLVLAPVYTLWEASSGLRNYYVPRQRMGEEFLREWEERHPGTPLRWVGGQWEDDIAIAFYGDPGIRAVEGMPDQMPATLSPVRDWATTPGLLLCALGSVKPGETDAIEVRETRCMENARQWIAGHGKVPEVIRLRLQREGWRFPEPIAFDYVGLAYLP